MTMDTAAIARLEVEVDHLKTAVETMQKSQEATAKNVQKLLDSANMGKGGYWMLVRLGLAISAIAGGIWAIIDKINIQVRV